MPLVHDTLERPYLLHPPQNRAGEPLALVVQLHGRGIDAGMFDRWTGFSTLATEEGFVLAMPSAIGEIWNDGRYRGHGWAHVETVDDVGYLLALIDDVSARHLIDPRRIYIVGMSNGATMAGRLGCEHGERLAALAQVAGTASAEVARLPFRGAPVPLLEIHGTGDASAPYDGGQPTGLRNRLILRHRAGPAVGVDGWAAAWVFANGARNEPGVSSLPPDTKVRRWQGDSPAAEVVFYRVEGGGHTWTGNRVWVPPLFGRTSRTFDATRVIWDFMRSHIRVGDDLDMTL